MARSNEMVKEPLEDEDEESKNSVPETPQNLGDFVVFGRYTIFIIIMYELLLMPQMFNMVFMMFGALEPTLKSCDSTNFTNMSKNETCAAYKVARNISGCEPILDPQFKSLAYEFQYFCDEISVVKHSISILMFGVLIGAILFGQLSDMFGRKKIMLICHLGIGILNFVASQADSLNYFTLVQFFAMAFVGGHNSIMHVFLLENVPKKFRVLLTALISYSPNFVFLSIAAWLSDDWRTLLKLCSFLNIPAFCLLLLAFESPRWLIQKAYLETARMALLKIEKINGTATPERLSIIDQIIEQEIKQNELKNRKSKKYYFWHLFCTWEMITYALVVSFSLATTSIVSYALMFNFERLPGNIFVSTAIFGLFRYAANLAVGALDYFITRAGRKFIHNGSGTYILLMLALILSSKFIGFNDAGFLRVATITSAAMCSQLYVINGIVTSELFPTAVRNLAVSFVQISNRLGAVVAPHLFLTNVLFEELPYLIMFLLMAINIVLFLVFIPETKGTPLSDHMPGKDERIKFRKARRKSTIVLSPTSAKLIEDF